jgi:hypothetical protein
MFAKIINDKVIEYPYDPKKDYPNTNFPAGLDYPQFNIYWVKAIYPINPDPQTLIAKETEPTKYLDKWQQSWEFIKLNTKTPDVIMPPCMSFTITDTLDSFKKEARIEFDLQKTNIQQLESKLDNLLSSANLKLSALETAMSNLVIGYEENQLAIQSYVPILDSLANKVEVLEKAIISSTSLSQLTEQLNQAIKQAQIVVPVPVNVVPTTNLFDFRDAVISNMIISKTSTLDITKNKGIVVTARRDTWEQGVIFRDVNRVLNSSFEIVFKPSANAAGLIGLAPLSNTPENWIYGSSFQKFFDISEYFADAGGMKVGYTYGNYKWGQNHDDLNVTQGVKLTYSTGPKVGSKCRLVNVDLNATDLHSKASEIGTAIEWIIQAAPAKVILDDKTALGLAVSLKTGSVEIYSTNFIPN